MHGTDDNTTQQPRTAQRGAEEGRGFSRTPRRLMCANNLKLLSLGVQKYDSAHDLRLPSAGTYPHNDRKHYHGKPSAMYMSAASLSKVSELFDTGSSHWLNDPRKTLWYSWTVQVLPYVEEEELASQFDLTRPVSDTPEAALKSQPALLLCPSDRSAGRYYESVLPGEAQQSSFGKGNYAAYTSTWSVGARGLSPGAIVVGGQSLVGIVDGMSRTILASEVRTSGVVADQRGAWALPWNASSLLAFGIEPEILLLQQLEFQWAQTPNSFTHGDVLYECVNPANTLLDSLPCTTNSALGVSSSPRSYHIGGVNTVFLDGRVSFLNDDIDPLVMAYLIGSQDDVRVVERGATDHD